MSVFEKQIVDALSRMPFAKELSIRPLLMGDELTMILPYAPHIIGNPMLKALHGGAVGAFMETTAIVQLWHMGDPKPLPRPIGIHIDYLRRGKPQDTYARAIVARQGSRVANVSVTAWQDNFDSPISSFRGNFMIAQTDD